MLILKGSSQLLTSSHLRERDKNAVECHFVWESLERIPSWQGQEGRRSLSVFVERGMVMVTCSGSVLSPLLLSFSMSGSCPNLPLSCLLIVANGPVVLLWHGWLPGLSCAGERDPWVTSCRIFGLLSSLSAVCGCLSCGFFCFFDPA